MVDDPLSSMITEAPDSTAAQAATEPATPVPTTITSASMVSAI